ncbi:hypothetical protein OsI_14712 [Oryza sativa Indica Group]|uniref:Protein kinase domain-containing protein n=1 Tax=Oryza sativa subsp. indica TaxID=39946 RepID=A2XPZ8_ORYSI|nr:hypothetical protein OsI_14712 [Oryza sativa Indica Group]
MEQNVFEKGTNGFRRFEYSDLAAATGHFSNSRKLGQGAFGVVYRGFLKRLGREVAVKKIVSKSSEGSSQKNKESNEGHKDFFAEVSTISEARHKNLVRFYGWCCRGHSWNILHLMCCCFRTKKNKELFLVYELVKNGNLYDYLYKSEAEEVLSWQTRYEIAKDIGSGLLYLHHECNPYILHRDIKPGNVLLDENFSAKLADFGLSRVANPDNGTVQTTAIGTEGYLDPLCMRDGKVRINRSSDVYSFGIVLLEIVCAGRHRVQIWDLYRSGGDVVAAADSRLAIDDNGADERRQMERVIILGLWCTASEAQQRPTMLQAMDVLERDAQLPDLNLVVNSTLASAETKMPPVRRPGKDMTEETALVAGSSSSQLAGYKPTR